MPERKLERDTAQFSFEGTTSSAVRHASVRLQGTRACHSVYSSAYDRTLGSDSFDRESARGCASDGEIFENCIEKNFHVPKHESGH
jgi:hypothetical protein